MESGALREEHPQGRGTWGEESCRMGILSVTQLGPLWGIVRVAAEERGCPSCVVPTLACV